MIVYDLHGPSSAFTPTETDPILIGDSDTVLASSASLQAFQSVSGWHPKILERFGVIDEEELLPGPAREVRWTDLSYRLGVDTVEDVLGTLVSELNCHNNTLAHLTCYPLLLCKIPQLPAMGRR